MIARPRILEELRRAWRRSPVVAPQVWGLMGRLRAGTDAGDPQAARRLLLGHPRGRRTSWPSGARGVSASSSSAPTRLP
jgi:hypothetical protein